MIKLTQIPCIQDMDLLADGIVNTNTKLLASLLTSLNDSTVPEPSVVVSSCIGQCWREKTVGWFGLAGRSRNAPLPPSGGTCSSKLQLGMALLSSYNMQYPCINNNDKIKMNSTFSYCHSLML